MLRRVICCAGHLKRTIESPSRHIAPPSTLHSPSSSSVMRSACAGPNRCWMGSGEFTEPRAHGSPFLNVRCCREHAQCTAVSIMTPTVEREGACRVAPLSAPPRSYQGRGRARCGFAPVVRIPPVFAVRPTAFLDSCGAARSRRSGASPPRQIKDDDHDHVVCARRCGVSRGRAR
jgi:hypothetical protein